MSRRILGLSLIVFLFTALPYGTAKSKDKKKSLLSDDVLQARDVLVTIDPEDGISLDHPNDNPMARQDVENALMTWGHFNLVMDAGSADLIFVVHRGTGKTVAPVVRGGPADDRPVIAESTSDADGESTRIGVQHGNRRTGLDDPDANTGPHVGESIGALQDMLTVFRGRQQLDSQRGDPLGEAPLWRFRSKDALHSPDVPAVNEFRKAFEEAETEAQNRTKKTP